MAVNLALLDENSEANEWEEQETVLAAEWGEAGNVSTRRWWKHHCWTRMSIVAGAILVVTSSLLGGVAYSTVSSTGDSQYACPDPFDSSANTPLDSFSPYRQLESQGTDFSIYLAHSMTICNTFRLRIARTNSTHCAEMIAPPDLELANPPQGPDSFRIRTEGAQRWATEMHHYEGDCSYRIDLVLSNAGSVTLDIFHTYENYNALRELKSWPPLLFLPLLPLPLELDACPRPYCPQYTSPAASHLNILALPLKTLAACESDSPQLGNYLPIHHFDRIVEPVPLVKVGGHSLTGLYNFVPQGCQWQGGGQRYNSRASCAGTELKNWTSLIVGDSHARATNDVMTHRLKGNDGPMQKPKNKYNRMSQSFGSLAVDFIWDPVGTWIRAAQCKDIEVFDSIAISVTSHLAAGSSEYLPSLAYMKAMEEIFTHLTNLSKTCPRHATPILVYLNSPAQPPRQDPYVKTKNDHRTNPRLATRNHEVQSVLLAGTSWRSVDAYSHTIGFCEEVMFTDKAHYYQTAAIESIVDETIHKLELCSKNRIGRQDVILESSYL